MNEKLFIIKLALKGFQEQYGVVLQPENFNVQSLPNNQFSDRAYEVYSISDADFLRLRLYLTFDRKDSKAAYRLEVDGSDHTNELGDEVYVSEGFVDQFYYLQGINRFLPLDPQTDVALSLASESDDIITSEDGDSILV